MIPKEVSIESTYAHQALEFFKELFTFESRWTELSAEKRYGNRLKKSKLGQAIAYSIAESAKLNGLNTFYYMKYLVEQLPNTRLDRPEALDHLLPWSEEIPEECKLQKKL